MEHCGGEESSTGDVTDSGVAAGSSWVKVTSWRRCNCKAKVAAAAIAVCTYNANAWDSAASYLSLQADHEGPQIFMLQEHRLQSAQCDAQRERIGRRGWSSVWEAAVQAHAGGWSSGVAIVSSSYLNVRPTPEAWAIGKDAADADERRSISGRVASARLTTRAFGEVAL